jgi:hypothetical protein
LIPAPKKKRQKKKKKTTGGKHRETLQDRGTGKDFLNRTPIGQEITARLTNGIA